MYWPPVSGIMLAISALVRTPKSVITPARTQTPSNSSGEPTWAAMTPGLRKMPEPMTPPVTIIVALNRPRAGIKPGCDLRFAICDLRLFAIALLIANDTPNPGALRSTALLAGRVEASPEVPARTYGESAKTGQSRGFSIGNRKSKIENQCPRPSHQSNNLCPPKIQMV